MSGVLLIRDAVSSPASDGLYDFDVMKSGLAIRVDGRSGSVWLWHREKGDDGSEASGHSLSGRRQGQDVSSWGCACLWQSKAAAQDAESESASGTSFVAGVLILRLLS